MVSRVMLAAVAVLAALCVVQATQLTVQTVYGPVTGFIDTVDGVSSRNWRGIRYAAAPTGSLRWQAPTEPDTWTSFSASSYGAGCPQNCQLPPHTCPVATAEDCLFINVWSPLNAEEGSLPVLFFIHGGHFEQGSGEGPFYDSVYAANYGNVVAVTFNYRLGALGWLRTTDLQGNFGLMDQIQALQWVQKNIANFGGDPSQITIYGESAGGTSVSTLLVSPAAAGLFHRAIIESNPFGLPVMAADEGVALGNRFSDDAGCGTPANVQCLMGLGVSTLLSAQAQAAHHLDIDDLLEIFYPWTPAIGDMLSDEPFNLLLAGQYNEVDAVMGGTVQEEGRLFVYSAFSNSLSKLEYEAILAAKFHLHVTAVLNQYPSVDGGDNRDIFSELVTDYLFRCPTRVVLASLADNSMTTFSYRFNHSFSFQGWGPNYPFCEGHVCHGSELPFVFDITTSGIFTFSAAEIALGQSMVEAWSSFGSTASPGDFWPQFEPRTNLTYVWSTETPGSISDLDYEICSFWESIGWNF